MEKKQSCYIIIIYRFHGSFMMSWLDPFVQGRKPAICDSVTLICKMFHEETLTV